MWPWSLVLMLITATSAGLLAWHEATRLDRQAQGESGPRNEPHGATELVLAALVAAVAAVMLLQMLLVPRIVH